MPEYITADCIKILLEAYKRRGNLYTIAVRSGISLETLNNFLEGTPLTDEQRKILLKPAIYND